jgi:hypothetical protein
LHIAHAAGDAAWAVESDDGTVLGRPEAVEWVGHVYSELKDALKIIEDTWFEGFEPKFVKGVVEKYMTYTEWGDPDGWVTREITCRNW